MLLIGASPADTPRDLLTIKAARSIAAEWRLVERAVADGKVSTHYAEQMRREARSQLGKALQSMSNPGSPAAVEISRLLGPSANIAPALDRAVTTLSAIEKQLETP